MVALSSRIGWHDDDPITELVQPVPDWHKDAACAGRDAACWFPERGETAEPARAVCAKCLVRVDCLAFALDNDERFGVWGGTSPGERETARKVSLTAVELLDAMDARPVAPVWETPPCEACGGLLGRKDLARGDGLCWACN